MLNFNTNFTFFAVKIVPQKYVLSEACENGKGMVIKMKIYDYNGKKNICGERVRQARQMQRLSQTDLAARLQIAGIIIERDSVSRIESGARFVADYELKILARVLKVELSWLLSEDEEN